MTKNLLTDIIELDDALQTRFGGSFTGNDLIANDMVLTPHLYFGRFIKTDDPSASDRNFPAISVECYDVVQDGAVLDGDLSVVVSEDTGASPPTRTISKAPQPYIFYYRISTWSREARQDRSLLTDLLATFPIKDTLVIDSTRSCYMLREPTPARLETNFKDQVTYQNTIEVAIYATIQPKAQTVYTQITSAEIKPHSGVEDPKEDGIRIVT